MANRYANVTATLALFIALGGTSWAVSTLPRNSVGTPQLRAGAVTGAKVRDGSLSAADFSTGTAGFGRRGPRGPLGPTGGVGSPGAPGAVGARGPSDASVDTGSSRKLSAQANVAITVNTLDALPAGSYMLTANAQAVDFANAGEIVTCRILANGQVVASTEIVVGNGSGSTRSGVLSSIATVTKAAPFVATQECFEDNALAQPAGVQNTHLVATRAESVRASTSP